MEQPRRQFLSETEDLIEQVFAALDQLREHPKPERQRELIDDIFRHVHRLKGSASSFGFSGLAEIAHEFEHLLSAMRAERVTSDATVIDTCENATTALSESLTLATEGIIEPSRRELFANLRALAPSVAADPLLDGGTAAVLSQLPAALAEGLSEQELRRLVRRHSEGISLFAVATSFEATSFEEPFYALKQKLAELGEVISTSPAVDPEQPKRINFQILLSSQESVQTLGTQLLSFPDVAITQLTSAADSASPQAATEVEPARQANALAGNFIRTDLDDLDQLLSATHDLSRLTNSALDSQLRFSSEDQRSNFESQAQQIRRSFLQVQRELINLRLVSLGPILQRAARAGRSAARLVNKEVDIEISGSDLRLDKLLCDAIADPLVHLVRNAIDHGIETPEARIAAGKSARGNVTIEAVRIGSRTRVRVTDDGGGIDPITISRAASALGITEPSSEVDLNTSLRLVFRPGFSTLSDSSTVSGRGVGLDIVETAVEQIGGEVRVSSELGQGSIFEIRLPVTFSLLDATIVKAGENFYCLANSDVVEIEKLRASEIESTNGNSLSTASGPVPLVQLRQMLGLSGSAAGDSSVVVCELPLSLAGETGELFEIREGQRLIGLVAEGAVRTEEVLVRNLGRHAGRWYGVAGATELRDGTIALVLDLPRLLANLKFKP